MSLCIPVFLTEVIDSLERGFKEKTNPDFLILEINSSRYAYNMTLSEVNFYVVKALLNLYPIKEADGNVLTAFNQIFAQLNGVLKNYIRGEQAMSDCLKAIEVSCSNMFVYLVLNLNLCGDTCMKSWNISLKTFFLYLFTLFLLRFNSLLLNVTL